MSNFTESQIIMNELFQPFSSSSVEFEKIVEGVTTFGKIKLNVNNFPITKKHLDFSIIQNWIDTVCRHNPEEIVSLYAPDGVLLGTVAKTMKVGQKDIMGYFNMFVSKKPCGYITEINVQNFGSDYAVADGTYTFELTNDEGNIDIVPARFTFVLRRVVGGPNTPNRGGWIIASHHSSVNPE